MGNSVSQGEGNERGSSLGKSSKINSFANLSCANCAKNNIQNCTHNQDNLRADDKNYQSTQSMRHGKMPSVSELTVIKESQNDNQGTTDQDIASKLGRNRNSESISELQKDIHQKQGNGKESDTDDEPYNFNLERFDSMMIDSEEGNSTFSQLRKREPAQNQDGKKKSRPLSYMIQKQMFENINASKNLLFKANPIPGINPVPKKDENKQKPLEVIDEKSMDLKHDDDSRVSSNVFMKMKTDPFKAKFDPTLKFVTQKNKTVTLNLNCNVNSHQPYIDIQVQKIKKMELKIIAHQNEDRSKLGKILPDDIQPVALTLWQKNTIIHPPQFNREIDFCDKNKTLVNLTEILKEEAASNSIQSYGSVVNLQNPS